MDWTISVGCFLQYFNIYFNSQIQAYTVVRVT